MDSPLLIVPAFMPNPTPPWLRSCSIFSETYSALLSVLLKLATAWQHKFRLVKKLQTYDNETAYITKIPGGIFGIFKINGLLQVHKK